MSDPVPIIKDDTRIANRSKVYFERAGFSAEVAHDGESGLTLARNLTPDQIILDLTLLHLVRCPVWFHRETDNSSWSSTTETLAGERDSSCQNHSGPRSSRAAVSSLSAQP